MGAFLMGRRDEGAPRRADSLGLGLGLASAALFLGVLACTPAERDYTTTGSGGAGGMGGTGGTGGGGTGGAGGSVPCPGTHRCAVPPAEGWSAPAAVVEGVPSPGCPESFPTLLVDTHDDVSAAPAICGCTCGAPEVDCGDVVLFYRQSCNAPYGPDVASGPPNTCLVATPKQNSVHAFFNEKPGPCPPMLETTLPKPASQTAIRACGGAATDGVCEGGLLCVPEPIAPFRLCVVRPGEHPCPPGYPDRAVHYEGTNDTRACTECMCSPPSEAKCKATVQPYSDTTCTTVKDPKLETDVNCIGSFSNYTYDVPQVVDPGSCSPGAVEPIGTIEIADPVTFCCATD